MRSVTALLVGCALIAACSGSEDSSATSPSSSSGGSSGAGSSSSGGSSSGGSSSGGSSSGGSSSGDASTNDGGGDGGGCFAPPLPAKKAPSIVIASEAPTRVYNGIQLAGTYDAYEMHVYSPNATPSTTPDLLKQAIHFDGVDTVTFRQEANGKITMQRYVIDAGKTTMTLDESCSDASFKSMPYYFYATTVGPVGSQFDEIEWPSSQGPGYAVYIVYRKPH